MQGEKKSNYYKSQQLACVNVVASAITNGTFTKRAKVLASKVFPVLETELKDGR